MPGRAATLAVLTVGVAATVGVYAASSALVARSTAVPDPVVVPTSPASAPPVPAPSPEPARKGPVTFAFAGDVHFESLNRQRLLADPATVFGPISQTLAAADIAMVNLESAVTDAGVAEPKQYVFRAPATAFDALRAAGIDVVSMANNHGLDYGVEGLRDSLAAAQQAQFPVVGIGQNAQAALAPWRTVVNGQRIAVLAASQVIDNYARVAWTAGADKAGMASAYQTEQLLAAVRQARASSDTVVVYLHWGVERSACPPPQAKDLAAQLVAAGADVLVGTHAHVLVGDGFLDRAYVHYGLGNFLWYARPGPTSETGVLQLTVDGRDVTDVSWLPARIVEQQPRLLTDGIEQARQAQLARRGCTGLSDAPR